MKNPQWHKKLIGFAVILLLYSAAALVLSSALYLLTANPSSTVLQDLPREIFRRSNLWDSLFFHPIHSALFIMLEAGALYLAFTTLGIGKSAQKAETICVTPDICIPAPAGHGEYGTARFASPQERRALCHSVVINWNAEPFRSLLAFGKARAYRIDHPDESGIEISIPEISLPLLPIGGKVVDLETLRRNREQISFLSKDLHFINIGTTGCGKTRSVVIQTLCLALMAGEDILVSDIKGELCAYTFYFAKLLGYEVGIVDFESPEKSVRVNLLQPVIDAVQCGDIAEATREAWDLTDILCNDSRTNEPVWTNGEKSVIAAAILCIVYDNRQRPEYQNMTNLYWFIAEMCTPVGQKIPLTEYVKTLPDSHPAHPLLSISSIAPSKMRGSFFTSALTTLRLFTDKNIYNMTKVTDWPLAAESSCPRITYILIPDERKSYYPIASLMVAQRYQMECSIARKHGGRLPRRSRYILDEFGNFSKLTDLTTKLTAARSRGILLDLYLQAFAMLEATYGREETTTIKDNCTWIYLQANANETRKEVSDKLNTYTCSTFGSGSSEGAGSSAHASTSSNTSLIGRKLLTEEEVGRIVRPYELICSSPHPIITKSPDLSQWKFNTVLGLGDEKHNTELIRQFHAGRKILPGSDDSIALWGIWKRFILQLETELKRQQAASSTHPSRYLGGFESSNE